MMCVSQTFYWEKMEVYFIILQRQHLKYVENCAEFTQHGPTPGLASHQHNSWH